MVTSQPLTLRVDGRTRELRNAGGGGRERRGRDRNSAALRLLTLEDRIHPSITPLGEFEPATYKTDDQRYPVVAADAAGNYVIAWQSWGHDGSRWGISAQRFSLSGQATGSEIQVNQTTADDQSQPAIAMSPNGAFVISWTSANQVYSDDIFARRYAADGTALSDEFRVNQNANILQNLSAIAVAPDGSFIVAWQDLRDWNTTWNIYARRYGANGTALGDEFQANTVTTYGQYWPSVAIASSGDFVIGWTSEFEDGSVNGVYAQRYNAAGVAQGGEILVNQTTVGDQFMYLSGVGMTPDGGFVGVWHGATAGNHYDVFARRFGADGTALTDEALVNTYTAGFQGYASVAVAPDGGYTVVWVSDGQDGSAWGIYGQDFAPNGTKVNGEVRLNELTDGNQMAPRVAVDGLGNYIAVWESECHDGSGLSVVGERLGGYLTATLMSETRSFTNNYMGESVLVTATVTTGVPGYSDQMFWRYHVTNTSTDSQTPFGYYQLFFPSAVVQVANVRNSVGWSNDTVTNSNGQATVINWHDPNPLLPLAIYPGKSGDFSFTSANIAIGHATGLFYEAGDGDVEGQCMAPAESTLSVTVDDYIPVNANNDNWDRTKPNDRWKVKSINGTDVPQPGLPKTRDFAVGHTYPNRPGETLPPNDLELKPITVQWTGNGGNLSVSSVAAGDGKIKFWTDQKKSAAYNGTALTGTSGTVTLYVEGTHESRKLKDVTIRVTYKDANNKDETVAKTTSITPVVKEFKGNPRAGTTVNFINGQNGLEGMAARQPPPAAGQQPLMSMRWHANVVRNGLTRNMEYVQDVIELKNNANGSGAGWVYTGGKPAKNFLPNPGSGLAYPALDSDGGIFYPSIPVLKADGTYDYDSEDGPNTGYPTVNGQPDVANSDAIDRRETFMLFLVARYDDDAIYAVYHMEWSFNTWATTGVTMNGDPNGVRAKAPVRDNRNPDNTAVPIMNGNASWQ